jgi:hypothetical protein
LRQFLSLVHWLLVGASGWNERGAGWSHEFGPNKSTPFGAVERVDERADASAHICPGQAVVNVIGNPVVIVDPVE